LDADFAEIQHLWRHLHRKASQHSHATVGCLLDADFAEIQHRVASLTPESITTFTRHHAFLKKATRNFHPDKARRSCESRENIDGFH